MEKLDIALFVFLLTLVSCNPNYDMKGLFNGTSEKVDRRFEESTRWNREHNYFNDHSELLVSDDYQIFVCADSHTDTTCCNLTKFYEEVKRARQKQPSTFTIHLGDLINGKNNFGFFSKAVGHDSLAFFKDSTFYVLGNHDIYFKQWRVFQNYFHTSVYWFCTKSKTSGRFLDLFICLDSAEGTLGKKQLAWLKAVLESNKNVGFRHKIIITHTNFFNSKNIAGHPSNYPIEETYMLCDIFRKHNIDMVWTGHEHNHSERIYGGVTYIVLATMQDSADFPEYMVVQMSDNIGYSTVRFVKNDTIVL